MKVVKAFSKFAHEYNKYNIIQKEVAKKLCSYLENKSYSNILDLGAGDGAIYTQLIKREIQFKQFTALDFSQEMLDIHPQKSKIEKICLDFNSPEFSNFFKKNQFEIIIASSSLQWSTNLTSVLSSLSHFSTQFYFSFFTANTFKTLHATAKINSPIYSKEEILEDLNKLFNYEVETINYTLNFDSVHEMLRYIKKSGVNGGIKQLSYKQMKSLILNYPLDYLEFEVMFIKGELKK